MFAMTANVAGAAVRRSRANPATLAAIDALARGVTALVGVVFAGLADARIVSALAARVTADIGSPRARACGCDDGDDDDDPRRRAIGDRCARSTRDARFARAASRVTIPERESVVYTVHYVVVFTCIVYHLIGFHRWYIRYTCSYIVGSVCDGAAPGVHGGRGVRGDSVYALYMGHVCVIYVWCLV